MVRHIMLNKVRAKRLQDGARATTNATNKSLSDKRKRMYRLFHKKRKELEVQNVKNLKSNYRNLRSSK